MLFKYIAFLTEESLGKLRKQELIAVMLKIQNKMESSDTKLAEEVRKLNESFEQVKSDLAIKKMLIASSTITSLKWREYVETVGISTPVPDNELEKTIVKL